MEKKSQMKMLESIFVLIIFMFLLVFGLAFYVGFTRVSGKDALREEAGLDIVEISQRIQYMPELQCTKGGKEIVADCLDIMKLEAFKTHSENNLRYLKILPNTVLEIKYIYPDYEGELDKTYYNNTPQNITRERYSKEAIFIPITLFNPENEAYGFGVATISVYYKW